MEKYTKIDTLYKRYQFNGNDCPNKKWLKFKNKIILGDFSDAEAKYLFDCLWEAYSKIDGTNSKIVFFPSTGEIKVGGKSDNSDSLCGQFEFLQEIANRIKPQLCAMFPPESARFTPVKGDDNKVQYWDKELHDFVVPTTEDYFGVYLEEVPVYVYGEYFGKGIQKAGVRYIQDGHDFLVFDIRQQGWWLPKEMRDNMCQTLGLKTVPFLGVFSLREIERMVMAGFKTKFYGASDPTLLEEGIVARPTVPMCDGRGNRIIVKVKYCDYVEYQRVRSEFTDDEFNEFSEWYRETIGV